MVETALVTGASGGIGEALARLIAASGKNVVLVARNALKLQQLADELSRAHRIDASVLAQDLSAPDAADNVRRALDERRITIDMLVNNAGYALFGEFVEEDLDEQTRMLQVNMITLTVLTRYLLPGMIERKRGRVLNVSSTAGFQPGPSMATYYASKAYVLSLSMALSEETSGTGVTVTCLCPGPTRTGFQERARQEKARLLKLANIWTAEQVAQVGYDAMMAGRPLVITGLLNKAVIQVQRLSPRMLAAKIVRFLHAEV